MNAVSILRTHLPDLRRAGPRFFLGGLFSRVARAETIAVPLPGSRGGGRAYIRPRQTDFSVLRQVFRDEEYRLPDVAAERIDRAYERIRAAGRVPVVVDAGANIGAASLWLKARFPEAAVVAIEPDPGNAALARRNLADLPDVTVLEAAVGGEPGFVSVVSADHAWAVKTERAEAGCPVVTIDDAVATVPSGQLLIVKIDIEGFESDLFQGDLGWLDRAVGVFIEPHDWMLPGKGSSRSFQAAFGARDFEIFLRGENLVYVRREPLP